MMTLMTLMGCDMLRHSPHIMGMNLEDKRVLMEFRELKS